MSEKNKAIDFILSLVKLGNVTLRQVYYIIDEYMRKLNGEAEHDSDIWDEIASIINDIIKTANKKAATLAYVKNGEKERGDFVPLTINGKTPKDRINYQIGIARRTTSRYLKDDQNRREDILLGTAFFNTKEAKEIQKSIHAQMIKSGAARASSSALFLSLVHRNIFGSILYSGRASESSIWRKSGVLKGIEVVTQGDSTVCEQCKALAGIYPPNYVFLGNHPNCRCYTVPLYSDNTKEISEIPSKAQEFWKIPKHQKWYKKTINYQLNSKFIKS